MDLIELAESGRPCRVLKNLRNGADELVLYKTCAGDWSGPFEAAGPGATKAAGEADERTLEIVASTPTVDSYGDIIVQTGWDLARYKRNPVLLTDHRASVDNVVGRAANVKKSKEALTMTGILDDATNLTAASLLARVRNKSLRTVSVGFYPKAWDKILDEEGNWNGGVKFLKQELIEVSFVAIPANPDAEFKPTKQAESEDAAFVTDAARGKITSIAVNLGLARIAGRF